MFATLSHETMQPGQVLARGVCRFLIEEGFAPVTEFSPRRGLRTDVTALGPSGEIWVVECKSSAADFLSDRKWRGYLDWCDRFFFAVAPEFPMELLPDEEGLIAADGFGAEVLRAAQPRKLASARRSAQTRKLARVASLRLRGAADAGAAAIVAASIGAEDEAG